MADTLVSARIPRAKKEAGVEILTSIGATTSDLINSAFDFVLSHKELPEAAAPKKTPDDFAAFLKASTLPVRWGDTPEEEIGDCKTLMRAQRMMDYESLA